MYPAAYSSSYSNVIAVSATDANDTFSSYSNKGSQVCVAAPGGYGYQEIGYVRYFNNQALQGKNIFSTTPNYTFNLAVDPVYSGDPYSSDVTQNYGYLPGTSMAAPHVSGIAGLILSVNPNLTPSQVTTIIQQTAEDKGTTGFDDYYGHGRVNAYKALKYALENYGGTLSQSFTIPSGETWDFAAGVTVKFPAGVSLTSKGILNINGTYSSPVTFTSVSGTSSGSWVSIILDSSTASNSNINYATINYGVGVQFLNGANATIQNSTINYCTQGIYFNNSAPTINNNVIYNPAQNGIYGNAPSSSPEIYSNKIERTTGQSYSGINISNGSQSFVAQNDISGFDYGMYYGGGVTVDFNDESWDGYYPNNRIRYCNRGLVAGWGSTANLLESTSGYNNISSNDNYSVWVYQSSEINSADNWWGGGSPTSLIQTRSSFNNGYILPVDPWGESALLKNSKNDKKFIVTKKTNSVNPIQVGYQLLKEKEYESAFYHYKEMLENDVYPKTAISQMLRLQNYSQTKHSAKNYAESYLANKTHDAHMARLLIGLKFQQGENQTALQLCDILSKEFPNTMEAIDARFMKYFYTLHTTKDYRSANEQLTTLTELYSAHEDPKVKNDLAMANYAIGNAFDIREHNNIVLNTANETISISNYPNPFNPSTSITFALPVSDKVILKVFDYLGREVSTLINDYKIAGQHTVVFNANTLASGIYFYRISTGTFSDVKKMLLLK